MIGLFREIYAAIGILLDVYSGVCAVIHPAGQKKGFRTCAGVAGEAEVTTQKEGQHGNYSGSVKFSDYCDADVTSGMIYSGTMTFSGSRGRFSKRLVFSGLNISNGDASLGMEGEMVILHPDDSTIEMVINLVVLDERTPKTCRFERFHLSGIDLDGGSLIELEMSGKFYDSDFGPAVIETPEPLLFFGSGSGYPAGGVITITGAPGKGGGPVRVELTAHSDTHYRIKADSDGYGMFDTHTGLLLWEEMLSY